MRSTNSTLVSALALGIFTLGGILLSGGAVLGEDFRVDNEVFVGKRTDPASRSTTIFHNGVVYDFMDEPDEVIVLDKAAERFVLLDMARRIRSDLSVEDVTTFTTQLQRSAEKNGDPFIGFLANPKFDEQFDEGSSELTLSSEWMIYRLELQSAGSPQLAHQYREFCDWYARLNTMLHQGAKPPTARLLVNEAISRHAATAREVELTVTPKKTFPPVRVTLRSRHQVIRQVAEADLDRVTQARQFMSIFKPVSFEQYRAAERL
ncbi:MAG TPA: hypothetical protein VE890_00275 [Thermoguttaceae bacterium]|nr:hypothetical protein [Thermoguttaceae bacterium]